MRPRMAPDCPRACGDYDRIMSMPKPLIFQRNRVGFDLYSAPAAFGLCEWQLPRSVRGCDQPGLLHRLPTPRRLH